MPLTAVTQKQTEILHYIKCLYPEFILRFCSTPTIFITGTKAKQFLLSIYPYAILKKEQIKLGLDFIELIPKVGHMGTNEDFTKRLNIQKQLKNLK